MEKFEKQESNTIIPLITPLLTINSSTIYAMSPHPRSVYSERCPSHKQSTFAQNSLSYTVQFTNHGILLNISI